jgi:hypothetical protein
MVIKRGYWHDCLGNKILIVKVTGLLFMFLILKKKKKTCTRHDIAEKNAELALNNNH